MSIKKIHTFIEIKAGKLDDDQIISRALEMGMDRKEAEEKLSTVKAAKRKTANKIFGIGIASLLIGIIVSVIATNSYQYEYFYWWGLVFFGVVMTITGFVLRRKTR